MLFGGSPPRGHGSRDLTMSPYYDANAAGAASGEAKKYTPVLGGAGGGVDIGNTSTISLSTRLQTPKEIDQSHTRLGQRSMLKVYMANQLELNEAEMAEYEEVVNELAQQLEDMTVERDELVSYTHQLSSERDEQLRVNAQQYAEEKKDLLGKIQGLEGTVGETKQLFVDMGVEGEDLGTRRQYLRDLRTQVLTSTHPLTHSHYLIPTDTHTDTVPLTQPVSYLLIFPHPLSCNTSYLLTHLLIYPSDTPSDTPTKTLYKHP